uniref:SET domain-containing protein n=1 Tax=Phytophthora ramorum TaxID=164328 RepID=H3GHY5_PHYRM
MAGLSASQLPPATLVAGDTIECFSRCFVWGRREGHRVAVVTRVDDSPEEDFPIDVDTGEVIPKDMMMKRVLDRFGVPVEAEVRTWRKLRTYNLVSGSFRAPSRAIALKEALENAVKASVEALHDLLPRVREEIVPESPLSDCGSSPVPGTGDDPSSTCIFDMTTPPVPTAPTSCPDNHCASEESGESTGGHEVIDLVSTQEAARETSSGSEAPDVLTSSAKEGVRVETSNGQIPNRYARSKIRHQGKDRHGVKKRSRKRRDLARCAVTRSGSKVQHARTVKAVSIKQQLRSPEIKARLENLKARRFMFSPSPLVIPSSHVEEAPWPPGIERTTECRSNGVAFRDIGAFDLCGCVGDCFLDRVGLGVFTTTALDVGDVIGKYCGELSELPGLVDGQPKQAVQQNSGYTLLYNAKSMARNYVYVDALKFGSITRFISHACHPNIAFVQLHNRSEVKVLVKMIANVKAGSQITVHYGKKRWFRCACDVCWCEDSNKKQ